MSVKYCTRCKELHNKKDLCEDFKKQLKDNPKLFEEAVNFTNLSAQYHLINSQSLDKVAQQVNKVVNSNFSFEGSHQVMRDIRVFKQMNVDAFSKSGVFNSVENAQSYYENATQNQLKNLFRKFTGTGQEIDWHIKKEGSLKRIFEKSKLLGEEMSNAPGIDGKIESRFFKSMKKGVTVKNSVSDKGLGTNISDILKALDKGTLQPDDIMIGSKGSKEAVKKMLEKNIIKATNENNQELLEKLLKAKESLKVEELGDYNKTIKSSERLMNKTKSGNAHTQITGQQIGKAVRNGAVIGAVVSLTISSITNFLQYKNEEITHKEAFTNIGQDTLKSAVVGGTIATAGLFFPAGFVGFGIGLAVGFVIGKTADNVLNEIYGKGSVEAILNSAGYVYGIAVNLEDLVKTLQKNYEIIDGNHRQISKTRESIRNTSKRIDNILEDF